MVARTLALLLIAFLMTNISVSDAQTSSSQSEPIRHTLRFPAPQTNRFEVSSVVPTAGRGEIEVMMAVWTPGSYLVREYARNVENITATDRDGRSVGVVKSAKNRWRITTGGGATVTISYRLYAREMTPRHNWVDVSFAMINGAPTFMTIAGDLARSHEVTVAPAPGWSRSITSLPPVDGRAHTYRAADFDTLVDSPILVGNPDVHEFQVDGKTHYLATEGADGLFDGARAIRDLERLVNEHRKVWGSLPFDRYVFFNLLTLPPGQGGGALEHGSSVLMLGDKFAMRARPAYTNWLELASHEFFHVWNVKRLRPVELGPFDYESEVLTRSLWIAEGITDYYGDLLVRRAGFTTSEEYLQALSGKIEEVQNTPGRLLQSVEQSSLDAWIRQYRPDENSINVSISYYTKGHVLGFLLDARIRAITSGAKSLDDVMRLAFRRHSGARGYTPTEFLATAEEVAGASLKPFWQAAIEGTAELDYTDALSTLGLRFRDVPANGGRWLGIATRNDAGRLVVAQVRSDGPAFLAGLNVDDELLGVDDVRVRPERFDARLGQFNAGDRVTLLVVRRDQLLRIPVTLAAPPVARWRLEPVAPPSDIQRRAAAGWLGL
ncbi:MAG: PDZ domain-containing protein [Vicinamibacterales bacterium]